MKLTDVQSQWCPGIPDVVRVLGMKRASVTRLELANPAKKQAVVT